MNTVDARSKQLKSKHFVPKKSQDTSKDKGALNSLLIVDRLWSYVNTDRIYITKFTTTK